MTVYIRKEDNPDLVRKFEPVLEINKFNDGKVSLKIRTLPYASVTLTFNNVISLESN